MSYSVFLNPAFLLCNKHLTFYLKDTGGSMGRGEGICFLALLLRRVFEALFLAGCPLLDYISLHPMVRLAFSH